MQCSHDRMCNIYLRREANQKTKFTLTIALEIFLQILSEFIKSSPVPAFNNKIQFLFFSVIPFFGLR